MEWFKAWEIIEQHPWVEYALWSCYTNTIYEQYLNTKEPLDDWYPRDVQLAALRKWVEAHVTYAAPRPFDTLPLHLRVRSSDFAVAGIRPVNLFVGSELSLWYSIGDTGYQSVRTESRLKDDTPAPHAASDLIGILLGRNLGKSLQLYGISCETTLETALVSVTPILAYDFYPFPEAWQPLR
jgi:hypothetical protein